MREIEIKLRAPDLLHVARVLTELGATIGETAIQEDQNYIHADDTRWFEDVMSGFSYPRVRKQPGKLPKLTVKKPLLNEMDCLEYEVSIDNADEIPGMLKLFGYIPGVYVKKSRRTVEYRDYTITLDDVEGLGSFVEIERVVEDGDAEAIQAEMFTFAKDVLGLDRDDRLMKGYDIMLHSARAL